MRRAADARAPRVVGRLRRRRRAVGRRGRHGRRRGGETTARPRINGALRGGVGGVEPLERLEVLRERGDRPAAQPHPDHPRAAPAVDGLRRAAAPLHQGPGVPQPGGVDALPRVDAAAHAPAQVEAAREHPPHRRLRGGPAPQGPPPAARAVRVDDRRALRPADRPRPLQHRDRLPLVLVRPTAVGRRADVAPCASTRPQGPPTLRGPAVGRRPRDPRVAFGRGRDPRLDARGVQRPRAQLLDPREEPVPAGRHGDAHLGHGPGGRLRHTSTTTTTTSTTTPTLHHHLSPHSTTSSYRSPRRKRIRSSATST